jgi:adenosylcobinamide-phosphate synthase
VAIAITVLAALLLDSLLGEPRRWHPLVQFGKWAQALETLTNKINTSCLALKIRGGLSLALLIFPLTAVTAYISHHYNTHYVFESFVLYLALGARSLNEHAQRVADALLLKRSAAARTLTSHLVSRDTDKMTETDMSRATIESTLENGNDAIFAPLFWFIVGGAPSVVFYRLTNTLDAMWGYRTPRYKHFGWAAARLDDALNFIPARLTALTYASLGHFQTALQCWRTQANKCKSPNGGPVMSSGAGALALELGGPTIYHGRLEDCPIIGCGERPHARDILQATRLVQRGTKLWLLVTWLVASVYTLA